MTTDFNYNNKTIDSGGPIKPSGTDQPGDPRTRVDFYSDIKLIPNPYVGMIITVKTDETNQNKMTDYKVLSLKPNSLGIANSVIDRVQRYVEYLGASSGGSVDLSGYATKDELNSKANTSDIPTNTSELYNDSGFLTSIPSEYVTETEMNEAIANVSSGGSVSQEEINTAVNNYLTEHPVSSGATAEQAAQIQANKTAIGDTNSGLIKEINDIKNTNRTFKNIYADNDMPTVFITSDTLTSLKSKADGTANCEFEIRFKNQIIKCFGTGKVQGNSSAGYPAKNYTFKFYSDKENTTKFKIDVGWGKQNKYCFKKNWVDSTHTRNLSGARIAYDMVNSRPESDFKTNLLNTPHNGSVDGFPIKVYVNGEFWGLYTWNIPKDAWMFNMDDKNPNHMILCAEYNNNGDNTQNNTCEFRATWRGESDANWSIEVGTYSEALKNSFNNAISHVMNSSDEDFKANFSNYFDLYSMLDYYCFSYLTAHIDGLGKNMLMATYDGVHWGACLYDMDSIYGANWDGQSFKNTNIRCPEEYCETNSLLWKRVEKSFSQELYDRYFELRNGALSLGNIVTHVEEIYNLIPDRIFNDDFQKWTTIPGQTTNTITRFRNYMRDRAAYCDERFKELILDRSVTGVTISGNSEVRVGDSITLTANLTPSIADVTTGSWSASNTNVTLNNSNGLRVVVNGSTLGSSTITFVSDDTTNGTISATHDINVVESGGEDTKAYEAELILQPVMAGRADWYLHRASTSIDCTGFECQAAFNYFDFPENPSSTDTSYMYCSESFPVVTDSEKKSNNIPCVSAISAIESGSKIAYITLKMSNLDASNLSQLKTYLTNNIITLKVNMRSEVSKYTFNMDNITMISTNHSKAGYVCGEFIDNSCPVVTTLNQINTAKAAFMAGVSSSDGWVTNIDYSYFKIENRDGNRYVGFQIAENLLETQDLNGIKKFISKNPTLFYVV